jgi:hypothetical protein
VISRGDIVVFSDDFTDNRNGWTQVAVVNGKGKAVARHAAIIDSAWSASTPGGASITSGVESSHMLDTPLSVTDGPVSIYMSVRVDSARGGDANRFGIVMREPSGGSFIGLVIRPGINGFIQYRNQEGKPTTAKLKGSSLPNPAAYYHFKLTLGAAWSVDGTISRAEAFYYDEATGAYESLGSVDDLIPLKAGVLETLVIQSRNGDDGLAAFDSVAITQTKR